MTQGVLIGRNCIPIIWFSNINYVVSTYELTLKRKGQVAKNKKQNPEHFTRCYRLSSVICNVNASFLTGTCVQNSNFC